MYIHYTYWVERCFNGNEVFDNQCITNIVISRVPPVLMRFIGVEISLLRLVHPAMF